MFLMGPDVQRHFLFWIMFFFQFEKHCLIAYVHGIRNSIVRHQRARKRRGDGGGLRGSIRQRIMTLGQTLTWRVVLMGGVPAREEGFVGKLSIQRVRGKV